MRLIDADALTGRMKEFLCDPKKCDNYGGVRCRACQFDDAFNWIDAEPRVDSVPIEPLAKWLAGYATPPIKARVGKPEPDYFGIRTGVWEDFLHGMDWMEEDDEGD